MRRPVCKMMMVLVGCELVIGIERLVDMPKIYRDPGESFGLDIENEEIPHDINDEYVGPKYNPNWETLQRQNIYLHPEPHLNRLIKLSRSNRQLQQTLKLDKSRLDGRRRSMAEDTGRQEGASFLESIIPKLGGSSSGGSSSSEMSGSPLFSGESGMAASSDGLMGFLSAVSNAIDNVASAGNSAIGGSTTTPSPSQKLLNGFLSVLNGFQTFGMGATDMYKQLIMQTGSAAAEGGSSLVEVV